MCCCNPKKKLNVEKMRKQLNKATPDIVEFVINMSTDYDRQVRQQVEAFRARMSAKHKVPHRIAIHLVDDAISMPYKIVRLRVERIEP